MLTLLAAVVACLPFGDLAVVGRPLAWLVASVLRIRRGHVDASMARAGIDEVHAGAMYASLATGVMELLWLVGGRKRDLARIVSVDPASRVWLDEVLVPGRGAVFGASHTGNWELAAAAMAERAPLFVLVKPVRMVMFDRFMRGLRARYGVGLLEGEGALVIARRELAAGHVVAMLVDQVPPREEHGDWLSFLGAPALTDRAPAALAASAGVPFVMTASRRDDDGRHVLHVLGVKWPPLRGRGAWARHVTRESLDELAAFVARYPDQWLWMHRRWRSPT